MFVFLTSLFQTGRHYLSAIFLATDYTFCRFLPWAHPRKLTSALFKVRRGELEHCHMKAYGGADL
jgi:hypothetical protein